MAIGTYASSEQRLPELCQRVLQMDAILDDVDSDEEMYGLGREHLKVGLLGHFSSDCEARGLMPVSNAHGLAPHSIFLSYITYIKASPAVRSGRGALERARKAVALRQPL